MQHVTVYGLQTCPPLHEVLPHVPWDASGRGFPASGLARSPPHAASDVVVRTRRIFKRRMISSSRRRRGFLRKQDPLLTVRIEQRILVVAERLEGIEPASSGP
jgi:hypothetical protein